MPLVWWSCDHQDKQREDKINSARCTLGLKNND